MVKQTEKIIRKIGKETDGLTKSQTYRRAGMQTDS